MNLPKENEFLLLYDYPAEHIPVWQVSTHYPAVGISMQYIRIALAYMDKLL